jgi:hypothetical protein
MKMVFVNGPKHKNIRLEIIKGHASFYLHKTTLDLASERHTQSLKDGNFCSPVRGTTRFRPRGGANVQIVTALFIKLRATYNKTTIHCNKIYMLTPNMDIQIFPSGHSLSEPEFDVPFSFRYFLNVYIIFSTIM